MTLADYSFPPAPKFAGHYSFLLALLLACNNDRHPTTVITSRITSASAFSSILVYVALLLLSGPDLWPPLSPRSPLSPPSLRLLAFPYVEGFTIPDLDLWLPGTPQILFSLPRKNNGCTLTHRRLLIFVRRLTSAFFFPCCRTYPTSPWATLPDVVPLV